MDDCQPSVGVSKQDRLNRLFSRNPLRKKTGIQLFTLKWTPFNHQSAGSPHQRPANLGSPSRRSHFRGGQQTRLLRGTTYGLEKVIFVWKSDMNFLQKRWWVCFRGAHSDPQVLKETAPGGHGALSWLQTSPWSETPLSDRGSFVDRKSHVTPPNWGNWEV